MFLLNILLALAWAALYGDFSPENLLFGFGVGYLTLIPLSRAQGKRNYIRKAPRIVWFCLYVVASIVVTNLKTASVVLFTPRQKLRPGIVAVPLDVKGDVEITLLAGLVALALGNLSLDVSNDRKVLYVHALDVGDPEEFRRSIKSGFERAIQELFA